MKLLIVKDELAALLRRMTAVLREMQLGMMQLYSSSPCSSLSLFKADIETVSKID